MKLSRLDNIAKFPSLLPPPCRQRYSGHAAYARSKLALVLFTYRLQQELTAGGFPVTANAVDPGMVDTALYRHLCCPAQLAQKLVARLLFWVSCGTSTRNRLVCLSCLLFMTV